MPDTLKKAGSLAQRKVSSGKLVKKSNNPAPIWEEIPSIKNSPTSPAVSSSQNSDKGSDLYETLAKYCAIERS